MSSENRPGGQGKSKPTPGQMLYHLFSAEERRRIVSIFLDNHAVAFSPSAMSEATGMDETTAAAMMDSLAAVGFLVAENDNEAYQRAASNDESVQRLVGDVNEDDTFYRVNKGSPVANALSKADVAAGEQIDEFFQAAPDITREN